jgi:membrane protease YdiL (CAAX protease family)
MSLFIFYILVFGYLGYTMYQANNLALDGHTMADPQTREVRRLLYISVGLLVLLAFFILLAALGDTQPTPETTEALPEISAFALFTGIVISLVSASVAYLVTQSGSVRFAVQRLIDDRGRFDAESPVHAVAVVFSLLILTTTIILFLANGGTDGAVETATEIAVGDVILQNNILFSAAFLGIGYSIRRGHNESLDRLGLRWPTGADIRWGVGVGLLFILGLLAVGAVFTLVFGDLNNEAANNQAAALSAPPLPVIVLMVMAIAIGEEVFFRGALQPIFGNLPTSVFFVLLHTQSILSPLILILVVLSLTLGWLREKHSTTAAIIAHFVYNLVQLLVLVAAPEAIIGIV